jgi:hypothetical protein
MVQVVQAGQAGVSLKKEYVTPDGSKVVNTVKDEHYPVGLESVPPNPARIRYAAGLTRSLGQFEFARIDVSLEMPCAPTDEGIEATYTYIVAWVDKKCTELIEEVDALNDTTDIDNDIPF